MTTSSGEPAPDRATTDGGRDPGRVGEGPARLERGPIRVLVTGSRSWDDHQVVWGALNQVHVACHGASLVIVHGGCPEGADALAAAWADNRASAGAWVTHEPHPADWSRQGRPAGLRRNVRMVEAGARLCLTFIDPCALTTCPRPQPHGSHGAVHCATTARDAGIPVHHHTRTTRQAGAHQR